MILIAKSTDESWYTKSLFNLGHNTLDKYLVGVAKIGYC